MVTAPCTLNNIQIRQFQSQLIPEQLELRITHIQCYNEKVEVLASIGAQKFCHFSIASSSSPHICSFLELVHQAKPIFNDGQFPTSTRDLTADWDHFHVLLEALLHR